MNDPASAAASNRSALVIGRYILHAPIARGGMATIHIARLTGVEGFSRIVAAKRLHPEFIEDQEFVTMFLDEARIASKVHHPNVVPVLDVVTTGTEIVLVQEYVHGVPLNVLLKEVRKRKTRVPLPIAVSVVAGALEGLHAAHEAKDELGNPLQIVHRDVSPHNVIVSVEGTPRILDFGVAKATLSAHVTREGTFKGKIAYTAPEQLRGVTAVSSDIYSAGVMLWEAIVGRRMHEGTPEQAVLAAVMTGELPTITKALQDSRESIADEDWEKILLLEPVVTIALALDPEDRFRTAADFEQAIADIVPRVTSTEVAAWVQDFGANYLAGRRKIIAQDETSWRRQMSGPDSAGSLDRASATGGEGPLSISAPSQSGVASRRPSPVPPDPPPPGLSRGRLWAIAGAVIVLAIALVAIGYLMRSEPPPEARAANQPATTPLPSSLPPAAAPAPADSTSSAASASAPAETAHVTPPHPAAAPAAVVVRAHAPAPAVAKRGGAGTDTGMPSASPPAAAADSCNPPYYFDGRKKLYKPGCI